MVPVAPPTADQKRIGGIYQYITQITGSDEQVRAAQAKLAALTPTTLAVYKALNLLPEGQLKSWLMANPVQFWKKVIQLFTGRKYNTGEYILGERLNDQVYCNGNIDRGQVSDSMVPIAKSVFTQLFGVRIATNDDLDALEAGIDAYKTRPVASGLSAAAINRAVYLKQNFFPNSTYNNTCWNLAYFEKYPLVDRIPDPETIGKWYTGDLIGGSKAVNGVITVDASNILSQYVGATFDPTTGQITTQGMPIGVANVAKYAPIIALLLVVGVVLSIKLGLYKR